MKIKTELVKSYIANFICNQIDDFEIEASKAADSIAVCMLAEIQELLKNKSFSDFEIVENIVKVFEKNNIDCGNCHDF